MSSVTYNGLSFEIVQGATADISVNGNLLMPELMLDYHPFGSGFRLTGGFGYTLDTELGGSAAPKGTIRITQDLSADASKFGILGAGIRYEGLAPYLGLGFGHAVPKKRVGLGLDMGMFYLSQPIATLVATRAFRRTEEEQPKFQENLNGYRWLGNISLKLSVKLN